MYLTSIKLIITLFIYLLILFYLYIYDIVHYFNTTSYSIFQFFIPLLYLSYKSHFIEFRIQGRKVFFLIHFFIFCHEKVTVNNFTNFFILFSLSKKISKKIFLAFSMRSKQRENFLFYFLTLLSNILSVRTCQYELFSIFFQFFIFYCSELYLISAIL